MDDNIPSPSPSSSVTCQVTELELDDKSSQKVDELQSDIKIETELESEESAKQSRCFICYYWMSSEGCEDLPSLNPYKASFKLVQIYKTLNIKLSTKTKALHEEFEPPLCPLCTENIQKCMNLAEELKQLENALSSLKKEVKQKLVDSFEEASEFSEQTTESLSDIMKTVNSIRMDSIKVLGISTSKNLPKSRKRKVKSPDVDKQIEETNAEKPYMILECLLEESNSLKEKQLKRSSRGRVIKQPKTDLYSYHTSSEDEEKKPAINKEINNDKDKTGEDDFEVIVDEREEWSPGSSNDDSSSNEDENFDSDIDYLDETFEELQTKSDIEDKGKSLKDTSRKRHKRKKSGFPIKVVNIDGEEFEGIFIPPDVKDELNPEDQVIIEPGSVVEIKETVMEGVMIKCTNQECSQTFKSVDRMKLHVKRTHEGNTRPYNCSLCEETFESPRTLKQHNMKEHGLKSSDWGKKKYHLCKFEGCKQQYRNPTELKIHIRTVHTHETPFQCEHCPTSFVSALKLEAHVEVTHQEVPPLRCEHCPRGFFRPHRLREHLKSHTGERSYLCEICSKAFSQPAYLRYHQTKHKELALEPYKCDLCNKTFATPVNLRIHHRTQHQNDYRYRCEICSHGATHLSHLRLHMRTHSGERPHICDICKKSFTRGSQLKIHIRSHTGERPYVCEVCPKTFTNSSKLRRHELTHSQVKPYKCRFCEKGFSQMTNLNSHIKCTHTNKKPKAVKKKEEELEVTPELIPHHQVFGISQQNLTNMPIQFQVVNADGLDSSEPTYTEFIILNQAL